MVYGWRQATLFALIPFVFQFGYYFALDFNVDFIEGHSFGFGQSNFNYENFKDMPSMVNNFSQAQTYIISVGLLNAGAFTFTNKAFV